MLRAIIRCAGRPREIFETLRHVCFGSKCEELQVSISSPLSWLERPFEPACRVVAFVPMPACRVAAFVPIPEVRGPFQNAPDWCSFSQLSCQRDVPKSRELT